MYTKILLHVVQVGGRLSKLDLFFVFVFFADLIFSLKTIVKARPRSKYELTLPTVR